MKFINEMIPPMDVRRLNVMGIHRMSPWPWTVNAERDVFLINEDPGRNEGSPAALELGWKSAVVRVLPEGFWEDVDRHQEEVQVLMPRALKHQKTEILQAVRESMIARGRFGRGSGIDAVTILSCGFF